MRDLQLDIKNFLILILILIIYRINILIDNEIISSYL